MISFLFLLPQIQDGDHYFKRPPPQKITSMPNHHVVETFFLITTNSRWRPLFQASPPQKITSMPNHHVVETFFQGHGI